MKSFIRVKFMTLLIGLVILLWITTGQTQSSGTIDSEVIITIAGEEYHYLPQPELGYVIKIRQEDNEVNAALQVSLEAMSLPENAIPIGGIGRRGVWIIENEQSVEQVQNTRMLFSGQSQYQYIAPLFLCNGDTVAVIPDIVVRVKPEIQAEQVQTISEKVGCSIIKPIDFTTREYLVEVLGRDADDVFRAVEQLNNIPIVEWACPNIAFQPKLCGQTMLDDFISGKQLLTDKILQSNSYNSIFPNDEYFPNQWHLCNTGQSGGTSGCDISAIEAWEITTGDPNIVVAVIGNGIDINHPDLSSNIVSGYDFVDIDEIATPLLGHSHNAHETACAGLIGAHGNNFIGVTGVTWNCGIMPIRISNVNGDGSETWIRWTDIADPLRWAAYHGADILSNSWCSSTIPSPIVHSSIIDVTKPGGIGRDGKGCVLLFAAGNEAHQGNPKQYPSTYPEVISVGATDHNDIRWFYSNYGPDLDIVAPSGCMSCNPKIAIWSTDITGLLGFSSDPVFTVGQLDYAGFGGTSASTPIAAGVAALILSIEPDLTNEEVRHFLERSAKDLGAPGKDDYYGWGRVDARAALDMVLAKRCDLNNDWIVDIEDLVMLIECWETPDSLADVAPATNRDGFVDYNDLELMMQYWQTEIPEPGLITHWKLDEVEGDIAYDSSGYYHDANVIGDLNWQPKGGLIGGAMELNGIYDFISTPFILNPSETSVFSVFAWIKGGLPGQTIISQANSANWLSTENEGHLMTELKGGSGASDLISEVVITDGQWHRIGFTWDGNYRILYVDDVIADIDIQQYLSDSIGGLYIGAGKNLDSGTFWTGMIDDVQIYDRVIIP